MNDFDLEIRPLFVPSPRCLSLTTIGEHIDDLSVSLPMATCESWLGLAAERAALSHSQLLCQLFMLEQLLLDARVTLGAQGVW